jgi:hypothetical protein
MKIFQSPFNGELEAWSRESLLALWFGETTSATTLTSVGHSITSGSGVVALFLFFFWDWSFGFLFRTAQGLDRSYFPCLLPALVTFVQPKLRISQP